MKKILYVNAAMNRESSRTERLAQAYLEKQTENVRDALANELNF